MSKIMLVNVAHTSTTKDYSWCAFTSLTRSFSEMMTDRGYDVLLFGGPENDARCKEHIDCSGGYDWNGERTPPYEPWHPGWANFNLNVIREMQQRYEPGDYICLTAGNVHESIALAFPDAMIIEPIAGYRGVMQRSNRVFPSHHQRSSVHAWNNPDPATNERFYDTVIPHWTDFSKEPTSNGEGDFLLFVGRLIESKGILVAGEIAKKMDKKLVVAGFGNESLVPKDAEFVGVVNPQQRFQLMSAARCVLMPTLYAEPFGVVAIEAMAAGAPVITTDFGAFPETVRNGLTGFRCSSLREFCEAVEKTKDFDRKTLRDIARLQFSSETISHHYDAYFKRLDTLWGDGWYA